MPAAPTVAIIGATGKTGKWALRGALQRNYLVRVLVRSPDKLEAILTEVFADKQDDAALLKSDVASLLAKITVVQGSATDQDRLVELCTGADVVMSFLGMTKPPEWIVQPGVEAIMKALNTMDRPPKFISMSSIGLGSSRPQADKAWGCCGCGAKIMIDYVLKEVFKDMQAAEDLILQSTDSKLVIIIARATVLSDRGGYYKDYTTRKPNYKLLEEDELGGLTFGVDRQYVAEAMLDMCESKSWDNKQPSIFPSPAE